MELKAYRNEIDRIDDEIVRLVQERMDVAAKIAEYKKEQGMAILQPAREREKLADVAEKVTQILLKRCFWSLIQFFTPVLLQKLK